MPERIPQHRPTPGLPPPADNRQTSAERGYGHSWRKLRAAYLASHPVCQHCQREAATDVDHIIPRRKGGTDDEWNLQALCHACHSRKTVKEDGGFGHRKG